MTNSTDVSDVEMTRFGQRVDLIKERHVRVKNEAKIASRGTNWDDIMLRDKFVRSENLRRCCFLPIRRNSVLDGLVGGWIHNKPVGWLVCLFADRSIGSAHNLSYPDT